MLIGLTGGYCAGKNAVAALLEERGWTAIDVDRLGHEAVELARDRIVERFGPGILGADGRVDRRALAALVFSDPVALRDQEAIIHPIAVRLLDERIAAAEAEARAAGVEARVCINAALLYVAPHALRCEAVLEVRAPLLQRLRRAWSRDKLGPGAALRRIRRQRGLWRKRRELGIRPLVVRNAGSLAELSRALDRALRRLESSRDPGGSPA